MFEEERDTRRELDKGSSSNAEGGERARELASGGWSLGKAFCVL